MYHQQTCAVEQIDERLGVEKKGNRAKLRPPEEDLATSRNIGCCSSFANDMFDIYIYIYIYIYLYI